MTTEHEVLGGSLLQSLEHHVRFGRNFYVLKFYLYMEITTYRRKCKLVNYEPLELPLSVRTHPHIHTHTNTHTHTHTHTHTQCCQNLCGKVAENL